MLWYIHTYPALIQGAIRIAEENIKDGNQYTIEHSFQSYFPGVVFIVSKPKFKNPNAK